MTDCSKDLEAVAGLMSGFDRQRFTAELERWFRTHHAEIAEALKDARITKKSAETLCRIYFEIAAETVGEEHVRAERDKRIAAMHNSAREDGE